MTAALRHIVAILVLPFVVGVVVPAWIRRSYAGIDSRWSEPALTWIGRSVGSVLVAVGVALAAWCVVLFAKVGRGTLAPWDPTSRLVAVGPYRYTRNPMISGVAFILAGQALFAGSRLLGLWLLVFVAINHTYFVLSEEPGLERRFGDAYREYKRSTPRWLPHRRRS